jgi:hypothetical protein
LTNWTPTRPTDRVEIVGFASSSRTLAHFDDPNVKIWSLNHAHSWIPRWDVFFEIHPKERLQIKDEHSEWLKAQPGPNTEGYKPIYMQEHYDEVPASVKFPKDEINTWLAKEFDAPPDYYTSSIAQMLALAMFQGYKSIGLYGIDMLNDDEYYYQRSGLEFIIGLAKGRGIKIDIPKESALLKCNYIYGYVAPPDKEFSGQRVRHAETITKSLEADRQAVSPHFHTFDGSLQALKLCKSIIQKNAKFKAIHALPEIEKELDKAIEDMENKRLSHLINLKQVEGAHNVSQSYVSWLSHEARGGTLQGST